MLEVKPEVRRYREFRAEATARVRMRVLLGSRKLSIR